MNNPHTAGRREVFRRLCLRLVENVFSMARAMPRQEQPAWLREIAAAHRLTADMIEAEAARLEGGEQ